MRHSGEKQKEKIIIKGHPFRWSYTPEWQKQKPHQMLLGDYLKQRQKTDKQNS